MLYSKYSNPMEFLRLYMDQGRFGEFVTETLLAEKKRKEDLAKKEDEDKWWNLYLHSYSDKSFARWKAEVTGGTERQKETPAKKHTENVDAMVQRLFRDVK